MDDTDVSLKNMDGSHQTLWFAYYIAVTEIECAEAREKAL